MRNRFLFPLLLTVFVFAPSAVAQEPDSVAWHRFFPAGVGDIWEYHYSYRYCPGNGFPCQDIDANYRFEVIDDTLIGGERLPLIQESSSGSLCVVQTADSVNIDVRQINGYLCIPGGGPVLEDIKLYDVEYNPTSLLISGGVYEVDAVLEDHSGGAGNYTEWELAADVGLVTRWHLYQSIGASSRSSRHTLLYARVNDVEYGTSVVANEPNAVEGEPFDIRVYPNPVARSATVELMLPEADRVGLRVVDLLGRVVAARDVGFRPGGTTTIELDLSSLAPGVYVLHVFSEDGSVVTRRITRVG